ncbi:CRT (chloroquine-resistance transporter)-like transporter 2 [Raphanus sativus]|uniref:Protein CLT2, chloroplastic n=1 Tax=Raphanus sativus TaxID=3726 RepID=A0A6J0MBY5_RAPSA|nr:protein CLT2, chloroplastic [Raphanus sativus]KAJ4913070.1 CRT (chloroquine-resistance transporter)-like transporter 2 [Raphanus sativus]
MDTHLMATTTRLRCLHATTTSSSAVPTAFRSLAIHQLSFRRSRLLSFRSATMNTRVRRSRFPLTRKTTSPTRRGLFSVRASTENNSIVPSNRKLIVVNSVVIVALAVANRVLYKLALVPMKQYPFLLSQLMTFGYVLIYFTILYSRRRLGIVTDEMLSVPKWRFAIIGFLEALGVATGMAAAAMLPGPVIPVLNQSFLVWQLLFAIFILGRRFLLKQVFGCLLVAVGVVVAVSSGSGADQTLSGIGLLWPAVMIVSSAFQAGASIIKEFVFNDAAKRLEGKSLDIFVVNSFGSGFQALFVFLLLPLLSNLKGIPFGSLLSYIKDGAGCFFNTGAKIAGCDGAPILPLLYIATNLAFNISVLHLVKISSAIVSSLAVVLSVPLSVYIMSKPLPYLPGGTSLSSNFMVGSIVLVLGLLLYNIPTTPTKQDTKTS